MEIWGHVPQALAIAMARPLGLLVILPVFTSRVLGGALVRNALLLMIALPIVPALRAEPVLQEALLDWLPLAGLALREVAVGALLGFFAAIPFWAIGMAGFFLDTARGSSMASVLNPMLGEQASIFGILFSHLLTVLFLTSGGFNILLGALYESYHALPLALSFGFADRFGVFCQQAWRSMWDLCLLFAMPAVGGMLLVDVALGLVNRSAQQLNVFFVAMPIKSGVALLLLAVSLPYALAPYTDYFANFAQTASTLMGLLR